MNWVSRLAVLTTGHTVALAELAVFFPGNGCDHHQYSFYRPAESGRLSWVEFLSCFAAYPDASGPLHWSKMRFDNMLRLRQEALNTARKSWADFLLVCEICSINSQVL